MGVGFMCHAIHVRTDFPICVVPAREKELAGEVRLVNEIRWRRGGASPVFQNFANVIVPGATSTGQRGGQREVLLVLYHL